MAIAASLANVLPPTTASGATSAQLRILQVIAPAPFGGAESVVRALAREYPGQTALAALLPHPGRHPFVDRLQSEGMEVFELSCGRRRYDREIQALGRILETYRPDVVHTHVYHADVVGYLAARRARIPIVATVHGLTGGDRKNRFYQWLDAKFLRRFDAVLCVSQLLRNIMLDAGCSEERVHVVPNPVAATSSAGAEAARNALCLPAERRAVGWIGRLSVEKGADLFVRTIARIPPPRPLGVLIGAGPESERVAQLAMDLGVRDDIHFAGARPDAADLIRAFDAVVLSSRTEGLPMVLLEALAAGVPVAAFSVGGIPDAVDESTAWLAPAEDVGALATTIQSVLRNPDEARRRSEAAREMAAKRYGAAQWAARLASIHRHVAEERRRG